MEASRGANNPKPIKSKSRFYFSYCQSYTASLCVPAFSLCLPASLLRSLCLRPICLPSLSHTALNASAQLFARKPGTQQDRALQTVLSCLLLTGSACQWNPDCQGLGWLFLSGAMLAPTWPPACPVCPWGLGLGGPWALSTLLPLPGQASGTQREPLLPAHQPSPSTSTCHHASWADKSAYCCD